MDRNLKVGIIGLGLIGGSIFKALCTLKVDTYGVSNSTYTINQASEYSKNISKSMLILKSCDIVFVCTPMNKTLEILDKLDNILSPNAVVADVCSLKEFVSTKKYSYKFIPTHPMAGTEFSGFDNSIKSLFNGIKWVLTPFEDTESKDITKITNIIEAFGAKAIFSTPKEHDKSVALISHMPMLVSQAIFKAAKNDNLAIQIASSGFRDMTRLALSNEELAQDMITLNPENIQDALLKLYTSIEELLGEDYISQIKKVKKSRQDMYLNGKNIL